MECQRNLVKGRRTTQKINKGKTKETAIASKMSPIQYFKTINVFHHVTAEDICKEKF